MVVNTGNSDRFWSRISEAGGQRHIRLDWQVVVWLMITFMVVMVTVSGVYVIDVFKNTMTGSERLTFSMSVAVGLTPEMLPMIVTGLNLSQGAIAMSKKKVIVKKLNSIQNFGAIDILCTDKTGTLTQDKIMLEKHVDVTNRTSEDVLRYAHMNSHYQTGFAQPAGSLHFIAHRSLTWIVSYRKGG